MRTIYDRTNAPTEILARREHHWIVTLGRNAIIRDHYRTQALAGNERITRLLPRKQKGRSQRLTTAIKSILRKIFGFNNILANRREISK